MAQPTHNLGEQMAQLEAARNLVLGDAALYPQIVQGILPIIGVNARLELRRWGADFLAETFASPALATSQKEHLAGAVVLTLREILEQPAEDMAVIESMVQTAASLYPHIFRHIIQHPEDVSTWENMTAIKQNILRRWDSAPHPIKICCIKFVQKAVQIQTPGTISDPRRPEQNETSLSIVPRNHVLLALPNLEAEASGLLDRLLTVFLENSDDAILVNATLNCLAVLIRSRPSVANKIILSILNFNPLKQANSPMTPPLRVCVKSMERTTRALLINVLKRNPNHPLAVKIQHYIDRLVQSRHEIFEEATRKRGLPVEPADVLDSAKRARLGVDTPPLVKVPPLPPGPTSISQLFTLTQDVGLSSFDVKQLPVDLIVKIAVPVLARVDQNALSQSIEAVRFRYQTLSKLQAAQPKPPVEDEEDDYEPEYQPTDVAGNANAIDEMVVDEVTELQPELMSLGPFVLPPPPPLTKEEAGNIGRGTVERIFDMLTSMDMPQKPTRGSNQQQLGFARLAASTFDRDAWITLLTRLATRASASVETDSKTKYDFATGNKLVISTTIREMLYRYIVEDFRSRINVGISWMNEEWYNDQIQLRYASMHKNDDILVPLHYDCWVLRLLDGFLPYLDARDKVLIRFVSEIPKLTIPIVERVKSLARDPERVNLSVQALLYLVMFRPPARDMCLDALEDIYRIYEESRPVVGKVLSKWRPQEIDQPTDQTKQEGPSLLSPQANGIKSAVLLENVADPESQVNAPVVQQQQQQQQYPEVGAAAG
jgi:symplekin